ncbi:MAG: GNAT family N-acetyltransferase [Myxococcales bacterium]|nr:GNAT family N-acetyltransferase [Myxococcales bacterium]
MRGTESGERSLRPALPADAAEVAQLVMASRRASMPWLPILHAHQDTVSFFGDVIAGPVEVWLEIVAARALVGVIAFGGGEIEHLYVVPGGWGQGTGARLLNLAQARREPLELWTFRRNQAAQRFYLRHGFKPLYETDGHANEEREPDIRYRWEPPADDTSELTTSAPPRPAP